MAGKVLEGSMMKQIMTGVLEEAAKEIDEGKIDIDKSVLEMLESLWIKKLELRKLQNPNIDIETELLNTTNEIEEESGQEEDEIFPDLVILPASASSSSSMLPSTKLSQVMKSLTDAKPVVKVKRLKLLSSQVDGEADTNDTSDDEDIDKDDDEDDDDDNDIDDDDDEDEDDDNANEDEDNDEGGVEEDPLGSDDDISDEDPADLFDTENVVVCQYDKITRARNKWKFHLKDGIMNLNGKDYVFQRASGDAEW